MPDSISHRFLAVIYKIWMMRHVKVPQEVSSALVSEFAASATRYKSTKLKNTARPKYIPVVAIVERANFATTLVPAGDGRYRLQINTALRKAADVGDVVSIELRLDRETGGLPVPADLRAA